MIRRCWWLIVVLTSYKSSSIISTMLVSVFIHIHILPYRNKRRSWEKRREGEDKDKSKLSYTVCCRHTRVCSSLSVAHFGQNCNVHLLFVHLVQSNKSSEEDSFFGVRQELLQQYSSLSDFILFDDEWDFISARGKSACANFAADFFWLVTANAPDNFLLWYDR